MNISSLLQIFQTMLETAVIVRAQYMAARAYGDTKGMIEAVNMAILIDEDVASILEERPFQSLELSGKTVPGTPEEIIELMRTMKRLESANISSMLKTLPGEVPELEERRQVAVKHKMMAVGNYFRMLKRVLREQWDAWTPAYEREFGSMLRLRAPKKTNRRRKS